MAKNQTFYLPQYEYRDEDGEEFWAMYEILVVGTIRNGWIIEYDRSRKVWIIWHPQVRAPIYGADTKKMAQKIADSIPYFDFKFSEDGFHAGLVCTKPEEYKPENIRKKIGYENVIHKVWLYEFGGNLSVWRDFSDEK